MTPTRESIGFFLPIRLGSQRVKHKNTRPFAGIAGGITELKLRQLKSCDALDVIVVSTDSPEVLDIARRIDPEGVRFVLDERPKHLCLDTTSLTDLIRYVPSVVPTDHILWGHTTTPFADATAYRTVVDAYFEGLAQGHDSLVTVLPLQNFLLDAQTKALVNYAGDVAEKWPRTQDLPLLYEVNHVAFAAPKALYLQRDDRIGSNPFLLEQNKIVSFDIDWQDDFTIAQAIYQQLYA